jgi:hypothetical protein
MILGKPADPSTPSQAKSRVTIDDIFRRLVQRRPDALALADPPNRESFTDGPPRRLTYAEADRMVWAIAGRLRRMGLSIDAVVGIQLPNVVEHVLTILGALRAGLIPAPLPLLWRRADAIAALARIGGKALVTCTRVGACRHADFILHVAAEVFSIRSVGSFGHGVPDGVVPLDDLFITEKLDPVPPLIRDRYYNSANHVAAVTFDVGGGGIVPVARNHLELLAGGLGILLEGRIAQDGALLSTVAPCSFAGLSLTLMPWLLSGGTLHLHHPFDLDALAAQWRDESCNALVLPAQVAFALKDAGVLADTSLTNVIAAWRSPESLAASPAWRQPGVALSDVPIFGEIGFVPARRGSDGKPAPLPLGTVATPRGVDGATPIAELALSEAGTVTLRGPMVAHHSFPPGVELTGLPYFQIGTDGFVDSGYAGLLDRAGGSIVVTAPPSGIVSVGGYRFPLRRLQEAVGRIDAQATLATLPDPMVGQRLIGHSVNRESVKNALDTAGVNPIVVAAFSERTSANRLLKELAQF